eukprot:TRINITY_DN20663_c0_g1_i1.p1 TRINITY_DN20663_c0_g1~~TRINITY_DN20663_c0_g1_i1.p1  ORF type:complete len:412 (+),score=82.48 TRINITY_DN20663_c0_g1_i1:151-1386(+)
MEAVGSLIISLHNNLQEIKSTLGNNGRTAAETALLQSTIERAEASLRAQARDFRAAAAAQIEEAALANVNPYAPTAYGTAPANGLIYPQIPLYGSPSQQRRMQSVPPGGFPTVPEPARLSQARAPGGTRQRPMRAPEYGARVRAKTTRAGRMLPQGNRLDPLADPPTLTEADLDSGLYNLAARGFIPQAADLTPAMERGMPVIVQRQAPLYDQALKHERREVAPPEELTAIKLDLSTPARPPLSAPLQRTPRSSVKHLAPLHQSSSSSLHHQSASSLPALPAPPSMMTSSFAEDKQGVAENMGTFCTELYEAAPPGVEPSFFTEPPLDPDTIKPSPEEILGKIRGHAATRIAAAFRGMQQRRRFAQILVWDRAARQIQRAWAMAATRMATKCLRVVGMRWSVAPTLVLRVC